MCWGQLRCERFALYRQCVGDSCVVNVLHYTDNVLGTAASSCVVNVLHYSCVVNVLHTTDNVLGTAARGCPRIAGRR